MSAAFRLWQRPSPAPRARQLAIPGAALIPAGEKTEGSVGILRSFWAWIAARVQYADEVVTDDPIDDLNRRGAFRGRGPQRRGADFRGLSSRIEASGRTLR